jgi:hypothetical protein
MNMLHRRDAMTAGGSGRPIWSPPRALVEPFAVTISPFREALATAMWTSSPRRYVAASDDRIQAINLTDLQIRPRELDCPGLADAQTTRICSPSGACATIVTCATHC